eukprot:6178791-Pleurochrysis_carterae.AAC.1
MSKRAGHLALQSVNRCSAGDNDVQLIAVVAWNDAHRSTHCQGYWLCVPSTSNASQFRICLFYVVVCPMT